MNSNEEFFECNEHSKPSGFASNGLVWPDGIGMIYFGMSPWEGMWKNRHQLMSRFASQMPVLYVEPPLKFRQVRKSRKHWLSLFNNIKSNNLRNIKEELYIHHQSSYFPVSHSKILRNFTESRWIDSIKESALSIGITHPIIWLSQPIQSSILGQFNETISIYHVVDEYSGYTGISPLVQKRNDQEEQVLLKNVTFTIVVSPELEVTKSGQNRKIYLVENAVDFNGFEKAMADSKVPIDLACIKPPRIGYSGLISKRLDFKILIGLAKSRPDYSIVLIGDVDSRDCECELNELNKLDNIHLLGSKDAKEVPSYIAGFNIGILPYVMNLETRHISPLKMYEYLATGLPIISSNIPATRRMSDYVDIVDNEKEFVKACEIALENPVPDLHYRIEKAKNNTWDHRVKQITRIINTHISDEHFKASKNDNFISSGKADG